jgi:TonB family protein
MERIRRTDAGGLAALKRLLFAIALSVLVHAWAVSFGLDRLRHGAEQAADTSIASPLTGGLVVSLQSTVSMPEATPGNVPEPVLERSAVSVVAAPDARYYTVEELDVLPVPRQPIRLPQAARVSGSIRLLARIDASGRVIDVTVYDSGADAAHNAAAVGAIQRCIFFAARKYGRPVRSEVVIDLPGIART